MKLTTLYKKNTQGKIEEWKVSAIGSDSYTITYGEVDGKKISKHYKTTEGKNLGKKNETSVEEQNRKEAQARWEKQLKKGYVQNLEDAEKGRTDKIIQGGILPMLAHKFEDHKDSIEFPIMVQPKLDGQRCIAIKQQSEVTLWTRTRKPITSCPHIIEQLSDLLIEFENIFLDGELFIHGKDNFEKIMSAVRKQNPTKESEQIEFHVYDADSISNIGETVFEKRIKFIYDLPDWQQHVKLVQTLICPNLKSVESMQKHFIELGYEGLMLRQPSSVYEQKRSKGLLKMKTFDDAEFEIVDFTQGEDETVIAVCRLENNKTFGATMSGDKKENQKYLKNKKLFIEKLLTVKYQGKTAYGVPRFPVGLRIRSEE